MARLQCLLFQVVDGGLDQLAAIIVHDDDAGAERRCGNQGLLLQSGKPDHGLREAGRPAGLTRGARLEVIRDT